MTGGLILATPLWRRPWPVDPAVPVACVNCSTLVWMSLQALSHPQVTGALCVPCYSPAMDLEFEVTGGRLDHVVAPSVARAILSEGSQWGVMIG